MCIRDRLILQVEYVASTYTYPDDCREYMAWRDATTRDVLCGELKISEVFDAKEQP